NLNHHTWPFSAIAELIDNAYDPDVNAKQFWIDKTMLRYRRCCLTAVNGVAPIGIYGNGFKSGSMRLGRDAIVFSKSKSTSCVGMLSQTYLEEIEAKQIIVPIVCFGQTETNKHILYLITSLIFLFDILRYSPFKKQEELFTELEVIGPPWSTEKTGTRIIIWNLRRTSAETVEFDFERDRYDIRIPSDVYEAGNNTSQHPASSSSSPTSYIPESVYSLRAYCSILYLKPRMQIIIRGQKVKSQLIAKSLAYIRKDHYKPTFIRRIPITFGYNTKSKDQYGIMMYHKNRLIKAYERVGCQLKANNQGVGVIGVIECNFLDPTHNKQSFIETDKYRKTMTNLGIKLEEYWKEMRYRRNKDNPNSTTPVEDTMKRPDQNWVQCDDCLRWRKLPDGIDCSKLPDKWFCCMNPDPQFRSCQVEEEPEDSDDDRPSYCKTYKQHNGLPLISNVCSLSPSHTMRYDVASFVSLDILISLCLRSILTVCCVHSRGKRTQAVTPQRMPKRPRVNGVSRRTLNTPSSVDVSPLCSSSAPDDDDDTDDDLVILETASTPKPQKPSVDLNKVKVEQESTDMNVCMLLESSDDAAVDVTSDKNTAGTSSTGSEAVGTSPSSAPPPEVTSTTTQTEVPKVKKEEIQCQTEGIGKAEESTYNNDDTEQTSHMTTDVCSTDITEVQEQQDQLLELMQETAQERDSYKEQVHNLSCQLQDMQSRLQELSEIHVKKECSHQASQTEETKEMEGRDDYKYLFEKAKQKVDELIKEKEALLATADNKPSTSRGEEEDTDDIALQVDYLMRELDQRNMERDELRSQVSVPALLEQEKEYLVAQCEELRQQLREKAQKESTTPPRATDSAEQTDTEEGEGTSISGTDSSSDTFRSLIELRQNIGRLLITYVPALDLGQVNYECNVIDEILDQVLSDEH
uniref:MORC family CW-type zinc finger 3a n=1 Tax=Lates calcarifer TaxID=8187 RepID=A0A4W6CED8_LATCA